MLLIYSLKITQRITYIFKHICTRILGIEIKFTSEIEEFIAFSGPKLSYGKVSLGNEMFIQSADLLLQQGFEGIDISVKEWEDTKCFFLVGKLSALPFDIFSASFYLLSRYEEYLPHVKDEKGRFLATESIAFKEKFLQDPVVDIWAYKFKSLLTETFPQLVFPQKEMRIHTLLNAKQLFAYKNKGLLRSLSGVSKDISKFNLSAVIKRVAVILGATKDPYNTFDWIINSTKESKAEMTVFFLIGEAVVFSEGTNSQRKSFKLLLKNIADYKQIGLMFSKESLADLEKLKTEKELLENSINRSLKNTMNDEYVVNLPENYRNLIELEVKKDYTMVYENAVGFRASTCTPFLFYDLDYEIVTPLLIHPIAATSQGVSNLKRKERQGFIEKIYTSVNNVNGTLSLFFTNKDFNNSVENEFLKSLFLKLTKK